MKIAILGFGQVGQKIAPLFSHAGHEIIVGLRSNFSRTAPYASAPLKEAAAAADTVVIALPFTACAQVLPALAEVTTAKTVIDSTNPLNPDWSPKWLGQHSAAEEISQLLPGAYIVKAFNSIFADVMDQPIFDGQPITAFVASDYPEAKQQVMRLAQEIGYAPLDTGALYTARYLEGMAHLNIQLAVNQGGGTQAAFFYRQRARI